MFIKIRSIIIVAALHGLILIGFGHAGAVVGLTIFFAPEFLSNPNVLDLLLIKADRLPAIGTLSIVGYCTLLIACFRHGRSRNILYLISIIVLWWSVAYLVINRDSWEMIYSHPVFYIPFLIVSIIPLFWQKLKPRVLSWLDN